VRVHTFLGILLALIGSLVVAYLAQQNNELIRQPFQVTETWAVPVYVILLTAFLVGFLPVVTVLLVKTLKQDLATRRQRRFEREARSVQGSYRRAVDYLEDGQWDRAADELETVLSDQPEDFDTLLRSGVSLRHQGKTEEAIEVHRRASVLYPQSVAVLYQLAEDYSAQGSVDVAREIHDRILRDFTGLGLRVLRQRRDQSLEAGDWATAERHQEGMITLESDSLAGIVDEREESVRRGLRFEKGVELVDGERYQEAVAVFEPILAASPGFKPAHIMLGEALAASGDPQAALSVWQRAWRTTGSPIFLQRIEDHFIEREEPLEAIETLHQIIAKADNDLVPRFFLGKLYARLEMHDEALRVLGSIRDRVHESPTLLYLMGRLYQRRGEGIQAGQAFRRGLEESRLAADLYLCSICRERYPQWLSRCGVCGNWGTIELQLDVEPIGSDDQILRERPVWPVYDKE
jgi:tetratricopeptide (TPR) repeat protein